MITKLPLITAKLSKFSEANKVFISSLQTNLLQDPTEWFKVRFQYRFLFPFFFFLLMKYAALLSVITKTFI